MARILLTFFGLLLLGLGVWLAVCWWAALLVALKGIAIILLVLLGLLMVIFGISELFGTRKMSG